MDLQAYACFLHDLLVDVRARLAEAGATDSTLIAAEATVPHLLPLFCSSTTWSGTQGQLAAQCGRSGQALRRSLKSLERAGVVEVQSKGKRGVEVRWLRDLPGRP